MNNEIEKNELGDVNPVNSNPTPTLYTEEQMREFAGEEYEKLMASNLPPDEKEFLEQFGYHPPRRRFADSSFYMIPMGFLVALAALVTFALPTAIFDSMKLSGIPLIIGSLFAALASIVVILVFTKRDGPIEILGLKSHSFRQFVLHLCILTVSLLGFSLLISLIVQDETIMDSGGSPTDMLEGYLDSPIMLLYFLLSIIVVAPFFEEFVFRGAMLGYFKRSVMGPCAAIFVTSLLWTLLHVQYNFSGKVAVFAMGLALGYARVKTDSLRLTVTLHSLKNAVASVIMLHFPEIL